MKQEVKCQNCQGWNKCGDPDANKNGDCKSYIPTKDKAFLKIVSYKEIDLRTPREEKLKICPR